MMAILPKPSSISRECVLLFLRENPLSTTNQVVTGTGSLSWIATREILDWLAQNGDIEKRDNGMSVLWVIK